MIAIKDLNSLSSTKSFVLVGKFIGELTESEFANIKQKNNDRTTNRFWSNFLSLAQTTTFICSNDKSLKLIMSSF